MRSSGAFPSRGTYREVKMPVRVGKRPRSGWEPLRAIRARSKIVQKCLERFRPVLL